MTIKIKRQVYEVIHERAELCISVICANAVMYNV